MENSPAKQAAERSGIIVRTSLIGIGANVLLAAFKAGVGLLAHSISVVLDAVNNLTDALSSVITIIGARLAGKPADKKHPLGHGRVEYLSAMLVAALVLYAGVTALIESIKKIVEPEETAYTAVSLIVIGAAIAVKLILGSYVKRMGEKARSDALKASGSDALFDAVLSASVLITALVRMLTGVSLEAWVGIVISSVIIKAGIEMMSDTLSELLGKRADREVVEAVRETICAHPLVHGAYDLLLHSYGPDTLVGSVHVEVPDSMTADGIDRLTREIQQRVLQEHGIIMAAIGISAFNTKDPLAVEMRKKVFDIALSTPYVLQAHGFYIDHQSKELRFDIVVSFDAPDRRAVWADICGKVSACYPDWTVLVALDSDLSD